MARKLRSMFSTPTPRPGSADPPTRPFVGAGALGGKLDGPPAGSVTGWSPAATPPAATPSGPGPTDDSASADRDEVARLAYLRWLETGGSAVENWLWAEDQLRRRSES